ncbi:unnamed protein product [Penicillium salamii]|nr:unnamed protein product [Penicillium salamii]CAG8373143.1 unnamed protein product [Penicillium salamii]
MRFALFAGLASLVSSVTATALTYRLEANEKACFYTNVEQSNAKLAFYFAVQSGGSFDVDYTVTAPGGKIVLDGAKERQGDFVFTAQSVGEYTFCFNNEMSTFAEKMVDFEIAVENEQRAELPSRQGASPEQTSSLEESIYKLSAQLSTVSRNQKYFRTRENRNFSTVRSTERRIFNFSVIESLMMVSMAALQVFVVRFFFQGARKGAYDWFLNSVVRSYKRAHARHTCGNMVPMRGESQYNHPCIFLRCTNMRQVTCDMTMSMKMRNNMMHFTTFLAWHVDLGYLGLYKIN